MQRKVKGFTLVELALAIASISILLLTVTYVINGITVSYRKGLSTKKINLIGRDITEELTTAIQEAPALSFSALCSDLYNKDTDADRESRNACIEDKAYKLFYQQYSYDINANGVNVESAPAFGVFCTGKYSYIWNTGYSVDKGNKYSPDNKVVPKAALRYKVIGGDTKEISQFRFLKVADPSQNLCAAKIKDNYRIDTTTTTDFYRFAFDDVLVLFDISNYGIASEPVEMITTSEMGGLAFYDFSVYRPAQEEYSKRLFYNGSFVLATINSGVSLLTNGNYCVPPPDIETSIDYCSINKFNFAARAIGG